MLKYNNRQHCSWRLQHSRQKIWNNIELNNIVYQLDLTDLIKYSLEYTLFLRTYKIFIKRDLKMRINKFKIKIIVRVHFLTRLKLKVSNRKKYIISLVLKIIKHSLNKLRFKENHKNQKIFCTEQKCNQNMSKCAG